MSNEIIVRERSSAELDPATYEFLENDKHAWQLIQAGVIELHRTGRHNRSLRAVNYVGHAVIRDRVLVISEKIPGSFAGLLSVCANVDGRLIDVPAGVSSQSELVQFFVSRYVDAVSAYVFAGREKHYQRRVECTS